jgi:lipopolysaccharide transport system ATP-binding protein
MAGDVVIRAEGLGKKYVIGHAAARERYVALRDVMVRGARNLWRKTADMARGRAIVAGDTAEEFWALRNVGFEVKRGEVLGIIGRNGAGKTTLLKILSRITEPNEGRVTIRGRVASLLEVGTGFHPELTGRENIYLNGAILGMSRAEIRLKFDEIVAFAEIEKFLDTPVKRYSSGMYVRLAFAVAAHLEPEILLIDEVLAVGDIEFQKKCLGKMSEVAGAGRTVLFVSHNLAAVKNLTSGGLVLDGGREMFYGATNEALSLYTQLITETPTTNKSAIDTRGIHTAIRKVQLIDECGQPVTNHITGQPLRIKVDFETDGTRGMSLEAFLLDQCGTRIAFFSDHHFHGRNLPTKPGLYEYQLEWEPVWLASGSYSLDVATVDANVAWDHYLHRAVTIEVPYCNPGDRSWDFRQNYSYGYFALVRKQTDFQTAQPVRVPSSAEPHQA